MTRTKESSKIDYVKIRKEMMRNAMAYNTSLTTLFLDEKSNEGLLCFCHPFDRVTFVKELKITVEERVWNANG